MKPNHRLHRFSQILFLLLAAPALSALQWPLKEKTNLTGTFGEFRKNHIHAGVDISTHGKIGLPVYASESGILYRIKTQYLGFGKAVYIKLKDGKFLVYAHLDRFNPEIEKILKKEQEKQEKFAVDIYPKEKISINKGDLIGYSGDTGGVAPHLHIELRDPDERPINILKYGLNIQDRCPRPGLAHFEVKGPASDITINFPIYHDTTPPIITGFAICDTTTTYCTTHYPTKEIPDEIPIFGKAGLSVSVYDPNYGNKLGIYKIDLILDEKLFFTLRMDTFSYDEFNDNFLLCNKDLYVNHNRIYYHLFRAFGNKLPFYPADSDGILDLSPGKHSVTINAFDNSGNKNSIRFKINSTPSSPKPSPPWGEGRVRGTDTWSSKDKLCAVTIKKEDLYYPVQVEIETIPTQNFGELIPVSKIYSIKPKEALFKKAMITIKTPSNLDRVALYKYEDGKWKYMDNNTITNFTQFALFRDTTPPKIQIVSTYPTFRAKIEDNGSGLDYDKLSLYIDGEKVIVEYSVNRKELFYTTPIGKHRINCVASDKLGNISKREIYY